MSKKNRCRNLDRAFQDSAAVQAIKKSAANDRGADSKVEIFSEKYTDKNKPRIEIEFVEIDEKNLRGVEKIF